MNKNQQAEHVKASILHKFDYLSKEDINACYDRALGDFVRLSYPSRNNRPNIEKLELDFADYQWIYARMIDLLERAGGTSVTAYKENGISFTFAASFIDPALASQIMPKASVPK